MQCCCPWLYARARPTGALSEHRKLVDIADVETGAAASDDEVWDDFDQPAVTTFVQPQRPKSLYGLDDEIPAAPVVDDDPFKDLGMAPALQRPKTHAVASHLASVWAEDKDKPIAGASAFAMDAMDLGTSSGGGGWAADNLDMTELKAEGRRAAQERRETTRRAAQAQPTGGTPRGKLHAVRTMGSTSDADHGDRSDGNKEH